MIKLMPKVVEEGSEWYLVSMSWINKWQKFVGFEDEDAESEATRDTSKDGAAPHPGKIDNKDII